MVCAIAKNNKHTRNENEQKTSEKHTHFLRKSVQEYNNYFWHFMKNKYEENQYQIKQITTHTKMDENINTWCIRICWNYEMIQWTK